MGFPNLGKLAKSSWQISKRNPQAAEVIEYLQEKKSYVLNKNYFPRVIQATNSRNKVTSITCQRREISTFRSSQMCVELNEIKELGNRITRNSIWKYAC